MQEQELIERSYGKHPSVYDYAGDKFEAIKKDKQQFELKIAIEQAKATNSETHEELEELCRIASEVPTSGISRAYPIRTEKTFYVA